MPVKTVAIVGSHIRTREAAPWDRKYVDIWLFNEAVSIGWPKRANAVFQMHKPAVWRNPLNRNDANYPAWLAKPHPYPIYMLDKYPDVPASVAYPLDEVCAQLLPGLYRGRSIGKRERIKGYFTSSIAYALALAIYQGYQVIHLYGVEMESDTEYKYQRDGVFFWIGIAQGAGIEVTVHPDSGFFTEPLYGYEGYASLTRAHFQERVDLISKIAAIKREAAEKAEATLVEVLEEISRAAEAGEENPPDTNKKFFAAIKAQVNAAIDYMAHEGGLSEAQRYVNKADVMDEHGGEHIFARQEFEITAGAAKRHLDQQRAAMQVAGGEATTLWKQMQEGIKAGQDVDGIAEQYFAAHERYLKQAAEFGRVTGIINENMHYLNLVDELIKAAGGVKSEEALLQEAAMTNGRPHLEAAHA